MRKNSKKAGLEEAGVFVVDIPAPEGAGDEKATEAPYGSTLATVHRIVTDLYEIGVFDKATMREFDEMCLTPVPVLDAKAIRELREEAGVSQAVLAKVLNVTTNAVGQWERGEKKPTGSALKLLALVREKGLSTVM